MYIKKFPNSIVTLKAKQNHPPRSHKQSLPKKTATKKKLIIVNRLMKEKVNRQNQHNNMNKL